MKAICFFVATVNDFLFKKSASKSIVWPFIFIFLSHSFKDKTSEKMKNLWYIFKYLDNYRVNMKQVVSFVLKEKYQNIVVLAFEMTTKLQKLVKSPKKLKIFKFYLFFCFNLVFYWFFVKNW